MPTFALIANGQIAASPYSIEQFRRDNPLVSLPLTPTPEQLAEVGMFDVVEAPRPELADDEEITGSEVALVDGVPTRQWTVGQREPEPQIVPDAVDMAQARLALLGAGITASAVDALIAEMPSPQKEAAQIEWEYRTTVRRSSPLIAALAPALGLTDEQIDALFIQAAGL